MCKNIPESNVSFEDRFRLGLEESEEFFNIRFNNKVNFKGKTVLDIGCGYSSSCVFVVENGSKRAVEVEINRGAIDFANYILSRDYQNIKDFIEVKHYDDIGNEKFDIVLSKDCFEHYKDPEIFINVMKNKSPKDGLLVLVLYGNHLMMGIFLIRLSFLGLI